MFLQIHEQQKHDLCHLLSAWGNIVIKEEEKAEKLIAFFASVFKSKTSCPQGTQPYKLEERNREQNDSPTIQGDMLHHLDKQKSMGSDGVHPGVLGELQK